MKRPHDGAEGDAHEVTVSPPGGVASPAGGRRRVVGGPTSSAAVAGDYVGLCCARRRASTPGDTVVDFGVIVSTRPGTLGQQWSVFWQAAGAAEEYRWAGLKQCLLTLNNLLEEGGPQAEAARDACTAVAAAAAQLSVQTGAAQAGGTSRPHRERVRSVRAPALAEQNLAVIGCGGVPEPAPAAAPSWMAPRAQTPSAKVYPGNSTPGSSYGHEGHAVSGHKPPASGFKGVYRSRHGRGGFRAEGKIKGRSFSVGSNFATAEEAARAYDQAARAYGIPEDRLNFPLGPGEEHQPVVRSSPGLSQGTPNGRKPPSSGFKGVYRARHRSTGWRAEFVHNGVKTNLGSYFETAEEAARLYDATARSHGVPERMLNFPKDVEPAATGGGAEAPQEQPPVSSALEAPSAPVAAAVMDDVMDEDEDDCPPGWEPMVRAGG